jgi:hypothetical protein
MQPQVAPEQAVKMLQAALPPRPKVPAPVELENVAPALLLPPAQRGAVTVALAGAGENGGRRRRLLGFGAWGGLWGLWGHGGGWGQLSLARVGGRSASVPVGREPSRCREGGGRLPSPSLPACAQCVTQLCLHRST